MFEPGDSIPQDVALKLQLAMIAGNAPSGEYLELRPLNPAGRQVFVSVRELRLAVATVQRLVPYHEVYVGAAPRAARRGRSDAICAVWCLWADLDTPDALERLHTFRPAPSVIVRSGTPGHLQVWWQLSEAIAPAWAHRANLRLAATLGADKASTDPARIMRPAGTVNRKTDTPQPVECVAVETYVYTMREVIAGLGDDREWTAPDRRPQTNRQTASPVSGALAGAARKVQGATTGNRNVCLNWAAYRLGQRVSTGEYDIHVVRAVLLTAALDAGLDSLEAERTIRSGLRAGIEAGR